MRNGIDFSFGSGLTTADILKGGMAFVGRYLSGGNTKDISKAELDNYIAAKIGVIFFWETTGVDMTSETNGVNDARAAQEELDKLGASDAVVFFAADEQTEPDTSGYMRGAAAVLTWKRCGIYGGYGTVNFALNENLCKYAVQTYAWSGSPTKWDNRALVRQYRNGVKFGPATVDLEQAAFWGKSTILTMDDDFGQYPAPKTSTGGGGTGTGPYNHTFDGKTTIGQQAKNRGETEGEFLANQTKYGSGVAAWIYRDKPPAGTNYKTTNP